MLIAYPHQGKTERKCHERAQRLDSAQRSYFVDLDQLHSGVDHHGRNLSMFCLAR